MNSSQRGEGTTFSHMPTATNVVQSHVYSVLKRNLYYAAEVSRGISSTKQATVLPCFCRYDA
eukprot:IDg20944t1